MALNVAAPINCLGYGVVGLNTALALDRVGAEPALWPIGPVDAPTQHHDALRRMMARTQAYNPKAPSVRVYHQFDLAQHVGKGPHCGMPIFELDRFKPNELHHLKAQDYLFANSHWAGSVLRDNGIPEDRIFFAPLGVDQSVFRPDPYDPQPAGTKTVVGSPTTFLNVGKWEYRKGHDVLLEAFNKAFEPSDNVRLVMHCHNPCLPGEVGTKYNEDWMRSYFTSKMGPRMEFTPGRMARHEDIARLMSGADCGVFPSRAEGWGLESAEMLAMGKHVILTDYSAHTEYADETVAHLIKVDRQEDAHDGYWFRADDSAWEGEPGRWAHLGEAQVDQLVEHMRWVHRRKQAGGLGANTAGAERMRHFTWENTAAEILAVLG